MVFGFSGSTASAALLVISMALGAWGCSTSEAPNAQTAQGARPRDPRFLPVACGVDQVREFYCDGLLPMSTALGAPEPYGNCPAGIEAPTGVYPSRQSVARFDAAHTEWARQRAKPGHACCYSWCSQVDVRELEQVPENAGCSQAGAVRESYCMPQLESGSSKPAEEFERCPVAIRPPEVIHFSVPPAAPLDLALTQERQTRGLAECCYGWCSRMPVGILGGKSSR
jgi:hypothetical protein